MSDPYSPESGDGSPLLEFMIVLAKNKRLIIGFPLIVCLITAAVTFALPNIYRANTKLLPPQQSTTGTAGALLAQLGGAAGAVAGAAGIKNPNDLYIGMLKSRLISTKLISQFNLQKVYGKDLLEKTRNELEDNTYIATGRDSFIVIEVEDEDPKRAAAMANAYSAELVELTKKLAVTEAGQRRLFYEQQLEMTKTNLANAEAALKGRIDKTGVVSVDADSRAVMETIGRLRAQVAAKEIQINAMQAFVTSNNQEFKRAREELVSQKEQLSKLQNGTQGGADDTAAAPNRSTGLESVKILRDVKYYQMLYEILAKQYEIARLDEAKDTAVIQVLDIAIPPERKYKPKRAIIVLTATAAAFVLAVIWAILSEMRRTSMLIPERVARWKQLQTYLRFK